MTRFDPVRWAVEQRFLPAPEFKLLCVLATQADGLLEVETSTRALAGDAHMTVSAVRKAIAELRPYLDIVSVGDAGPMRIRFQPESPNAQVVAPRRRQGGR